jgi:hypothetical protein
VTEQFLFGDSAMTRSELVRAASEKLGRPVNFSSIQYGQLIGEIERGDRLPDGWMIYNDRHLEQVIAYFKKRSHRARRRPLASC